MHPHPTQPDRREQRAVLELSGLAEAHLGEMRRGSITWLLVHALRARLEWHAHRTWGPDWETDLAEHEGVFHLRHPSDQTAYCGDAADGPDATRLCPRCADVALAPDTWTPELVDRLLHDCDEGGRG
jgi:hypothetical protein